MPTFTRDQATIHYDVEGDGDPVLILAPGGMMSHNDLWNNAPWNPRERLAGMYRLIGMDQRNAGASTAPITATSSWDDYTADQIALLDHLGVETCQVIGMCIGGPYIVNLLRAAPSRFRAAVLLQPAGIDDTQQPMRDMFRQWAASKAEAHPHMTEADWTSFEDNMWDHDFVITATPDQIADITVPLLVMMGDDPYHPQSVSRTIAAAAPNATLVERWKQPEHLEQTDATIKQFLAAHAA